MIKWLAPGAAMLLAGCSPPPPVVIAALEGGKLTFHIRQGGMVGRIFGWDDNKETVQRLTLMVGKTAAISFEMNGRMFRSCQSSMNFPVQFAEQRCGYAWKGASAFRPGVIYDVHLKPCFGPPGQCDDSYGPYWSDGLVGRFKIGRDGRVVNFRPDYGATEGGA
ncbi:hypothetical protein HHL08_01470 [Sphingobium sp. AR-3-1]|uniref:Lipoprotein n=1 Tax=Sphingobium psychrophilum TaxID=2728834 RepID=A0A7X9WRZ3_9SPHN|nr:hypothetical protein [Sphingobium psychrophilum]NML08826.1 hypothetical protein [Sphingobium psychrophilum]